MRLPCPRCLSTLITAGTKAWCPQCGHKTSTFLEHPWIQPNRTDPYHCQDPECMNEHINPDGTDVVCAMCNGLTAHRPCDVCGGDPQAPIRAEEYVPVEVEQTKQREAATDQLCSKCGELLIEAAFGIGICANGHQERIYDVRTAGFEDDLNENDEWMTGQCAAWAIAHQQLHPDLRFGMHYEKMDDWDSEKEAEENGEEWDGTPAYEIQHVFTHDDNFAYDASGKHPMPYQGWDAQVFDLTEDDVRDSGMFESGYAPEHEWLKKNDPRTAAQDVRTVNFGTLYASCPQELFPDNQDERISSLTRKKMLENKALTEERFGPDASNVVHELPNGWTVRKLNTYGDALYEGELMHNCFSPFQLEPENHHGVWNQHPDAMFLHPTTGQMVSHSQINWNWGVPDEHGYQFDGTEYAGMPVSSNDDGSIKLDFDTSLALPDNVYSLRDPDNVPHVTVDSNSTLGRHNSWPKPEYMEMLHQWDELEAGDDIHAQEYDDEYDYRTAALPPWNGFTGNVTYHVTTPEAAQELLRYGYSLDVPYERNYGWAERGLYMWPDIESARSWAGNPQYRPGGHVVIMAIDLDCAKTELYHDDYGKVENSYSESLMTSEDIPASCFSIVEEWTDGVRTAARGDEGYCRNCGHKLYMGGTPGLTGTVQCGVCGLHQVATMPMLQEKNREWHQWKEDDQMFEPTGQMTTDKLYCPDCGTKVNFGSTYASCPGCNQGMIPRSTLVEKQTKTANVMWHIAPTEERARIQTHGLQPSNPKVMNPWVGDQPAGVYLMSAPWIRAELQDHPEFQRPMDMWKVDASDLPLEEVHDGLTFPSMVHPDVIGPERLELVQPFESTGDAEYAWQKKDRWEYEDEMDDWLLNQPKQSAKVSEYNRDYGWGRDIYQQRQAASPQQPIAYYHVAPQSARESIMQHGLRGGEHPSPWGNRDEYLRTAPYSHPGAPMENYLFSDLGHAQDYRDSLASWGTRDALPYDIWQVDPQGLNVEDDPENYDAYETERTMQHDGQDVWGQDEEGNDLDYEYPQWMDYNREKGNVYPYRHVVREPIGPERLILLNNERLGAAPQVYYYHVAPRSARESIAQHGLDFGRRVEPDWRDWYEEEMRNKAPQGNYLWADPSEARDMWEHTPDHDIYQVDAKGLDIEPDPFREHSDFSGYDHAYIVRQPIPTHRLQIIDPTSLPRWGEPRVKSVQSQCVQPQCVQPITPPTASPSHTRVYSDTADVNYLTSQGWLADQSCPHCYASECYIDPYDSKKAFCADCGFEWPHNVQQPVDVSYKELDALGPRTVRQGTYKPSWLQQALGNSNSNGKGNGKNAEDLLGVPMERCDRQSMHRSIILPKRGFSSRSPNGTAGGDSLRESAMTRNQKLQAMKNHDRRYGPGDSTVEYKYPDGWSIHALHDYGAMFREGELMHNCFSHEYSDMPHELWDEHPKTQFELTKDRSYTYYPDAMTMNAEDFAEPLSRTLYSLRDPDGISRLSIDFEPPGGDEFNVAYGAHNSDPKPEYLARLREWAKNDPQLAQEGWDKTWDPKNFYPNQKVGGWGEADEISSDDIDEIAGRVRGMKGEVNPPRYLYHASDAVPDDIEEYGLVSGYGDLQVRNQGHGYDPAIGTWSMPGVYAVDNYRDLGPWADYDSMIYRIDTADLPHEIVPDYNAKGAWRIKGDIHPQHIENLGAAENLDWRKDAPMEALKKMTMAYDP